MARALVLASAVLFFVGGGVGVRALGGVEAGRGLAGAGAGDAGHGAGARGALAGLEALGTAVGPDDHRRAAGATHPGDGGVARERTRLPRLGLGRRLLGQREAPGERERGAQERAKGRPFFTG